MGSARSRRPRSSRNSTRPKPEPPSLLVIAGPSGVGKTSVVAGLLARRPDLILSVSATTRAPRAGERDGEQYRFVTEAGFDRLIADGALLEWATVHGHRYGTPRDQVEHAAAAGKTVVLDIDVQGTRQVRDAVPGALTIFIMPPSLDELRRRLAGRGTESEEALARRLAAAEAEMAEAPRFDHVVVNRELGAAIEAVGRILDGTPVDEE